MKFSFLVMACIFASNTSFAQLKKTPVCPPFQVDIISGSINKFSPKSSLMEIKNEFPCFNLIVEESDSSTKCKGIFYSDKGIYFFTERDYIEINEKFDGVMTPKLLGADRKSLFALFGYPKIKDITWDAFQMVYGILILYYDKAGRINKIQISSKTVDNIKLCE